MFDNDCDNEMYRRIRQKIEHDTKCCKPVAIGPTGPTGPTGPQGATPPLFYSSLFLNGKIP